MAPRSVESGSPGMDAMRKAVADPDQPHNEKRDPKVPFFAT